MPPLPIVLVAWKRPSRFCSYQGPVHVKRSNLSRVAHTAEFTDQKRAINLLKLAFLRRADGVLRRCLRLLFLSWGTRGRSAVFSSLPVQLGPLGRTLTFIMHIGILIDAGKRLLIQSVLLV